MAFRYKLIHHPEASADYQDALAYFGELDEDLANLFKDDFKAVLLGLTTGRASGTLYAEGYQLRWVKLKRFSHKVFFEPDGDHVRFVLAVVSGKRHPARIRRILGARSNE
ncbi:ParE-like toxin of type II ParDE toxin-antitoxin system [Prosthecobacter fusiformis]|uniref:ParE-like toxin of type II ParDE toxin-antitoxin system n=1 Tax=Prosthecobacter fusiformis TaxID=48464 RepID=A0A4R7SPS1_9BACT|nr:type II toxin-antitoxin system RelE/ParE family toxin [Prosthecobacter fusiformis]TDU81001.1 ParE-like toxin of type II ParDE toxin-antitoxin system [Prosthecobacter fusiformis]